MNDKPTYETIRTACNGCVRYTVRKVGTETPIIVLRNEETAKRITATLNEG